MNWQPIETAPKDGSMILLGRGPIEDCDAISVPGFWQEGWDDSIDDMGCDSGFVDVHFQEFGGGRSFGAEKYQRAPNQPTHWMPLPAAPDAKCQTCSGHGAVGNIVNSEPCPDCTPAPVSSDTERLEWLAREDNCVVCEGVNGFWLCWVDEHDHARSEYQRGSFPTFRAAIDAAKAAAKESP